MKEKGRTRAEGIFICKNENWVFFLSHLCQDHFSPLCFVSCCKWGHEHAWEQKSGINIGNTNRFSSPATSSLGLRYNNAFSWTGEWQQMVDVSCARWECLYRCQVSRVCVCDAWWLTAAPSSVTTEAWSETWHKGTSAFAHMPPGVVCKSCYLQPSRQHHSIFLLTAFLLRFKNVPVVTAGSHALIASVPKKPVCLSDKLEVSVEMTTDIWNNRLA